MAPRRRSTKRGRKISNKSMRGGKNWCCNRNDCKEQGWAPRCSLGNVKYLCADNVTSENVTNLCKPEVFKGENWCCDRGDCKQQGWAPTCSPGNAKYVCADESVIPQNVTTNCRQAGVSIAANGTGLALKKTVAAFANGLVQSRGGKKSKRRKSNKNRRTNKRK